MRRYNWEPDGRLTNLAKAMECVSCTMCLMICAGLNQAATSRRPVDDLQVARCPTYSLNTADMITESIIAILQPHTSSPSLHVIARAITSLIAGNFSSDELCQILNAQLDTLAISPHAKQGILPALFGITKVTEIQSESQG